MTVFFVTNCHQIKVAYKFVKQCKQSKTGKFKERFILEDLSYSHLDKNWMTHSHLDNDTVELSKIKLETVMATVMSILSNTSSSFQTRNGT